MPMKKHLYPKDWEALARQVKDAANWHCQQCGKPCRRPKQSWDEFEAYLLHDVKAPWFNQAIEELPDGKFKTYPNRFTLTVAHINGNPADCSVENLKALCAPCHLRHDVDQHIQSRKASKYEKRQKQGQLLLF